MNRRRSIVTLAMGTAVAVLALLAVLSTGDGDIELEVIGPPAGPTPQQTSTGPGSAPAGGTAGSQTTAPFGETGSTSSGSTSTPGSGSSPPPSASVVKPKLPGPSPAPSPADGVIPTLLCTVQDLADIKQAADALRLPLLTEQAELEGLLVELGGQLATLQAELAKLHGLPLVGALVAGLNAQITDVLAEITGLEAQLAEVAAELEAVDALEQEAVDLCMLGEDALSVF